MHFGLLLSNLPHVSTGHAESTESAASAEYAALLSNCSAIADKHPLGALMRRQLRFWCDALQLAVTPRG